MKISKDRWRGVAALTIASAIMLGCVGCHGAGSDAGGQNHSANHSNTAALFSIPQDQMSHVQVITVEPTTLKRTLRLTGSVAYNSFHTTPVITQVSGPVSRIVVVPGQRVIPAEPMLYVASPDFSQLRTNYLKAKAAYVLAQQASARAKDLYQHHAIAEQNLEQAESAEVQAGGDLAATEAALKVLGITNPDALVKSPPSFEVPVRAPIAGQVVEQNVAVGQLIQTGATQCFMVSDTSNVWVLVNVYQKDLPNVRVGDPVTIQTESYPDIFHGRISYVAASLDPNTRTLQARIETGNPLGGAGVFHADLEVHLRRRGIVGWRLRWLALGLLLRRSFLRLFHSLLHLLEGHDGVLLFPVIDIGDRLFVEIEDFGRIGVDVGHVIALYQDC